MNAQVKQIEFLNDRHYQIELDSVKRYFPSVTTILDIINKPFLFKWVGELGLEEATRQKVESARRGDRIHYGWYILCENGKVVFNPRIKPNFTIDEVYSLCKQANNKIAILEHQDEIWDILKLKKVVKRLSPKILYNERVIYSLIHEVAGTLDNIFFVNEGEYEISGSKPLYLPEGNYLVDVKTGHEIPDTVGMQVASYAQMAVEMNLVSDIKGGIVLHTGASKIKKGIEGLKTVYITREELDEEFQSFLLAAALWKRKNTETKPKFFEFPSVITLEEEGIPFND